VRLSGKDSRLQVLQELYKTEVTLQVCLKLRMRAAVLLSHCSLESKKLGFKTLVTNVDTT
jgi:hypothetical protein